MILLDTNVVIDAGDRSSPYRRWSKEFIAESVSGAGASINAVTLVELCVGQDDDHLVQSDLRAAGIQILDVPADVAPICGKAYAVYRRARRKSGGSIAPLVPLPDFFIGAHAELMGWKLATRDTKRFRLYFPKVELVEPI